MISPFGRNSTPASVLLQMDTIADEFEASLRRGQMPSLEAFVRRIDSRYQPRLRRELLSVIRECGVAGVPDPAAPETDSIEHFQLLERLGSGSFGSVWKAFDSRLHRIIALKVAHGQTVDDEERFFREARVSASLAHPNIVRILEVGKWGQHLCIVREFVDGVSLAEVLKDGPVTEKRAASLGVQICAGLKYSHEANCFHRDLKPRNILIRADDMAVITDFGLAKNESASDSLTASGQIVGTPAYMAPEQARGDSHRVDARSDIWAMGVILYQMLTGEQPFRGSFEMVVVQILNDDPVSPRRLNRNISPDMATIVLKCLEKEPKNRYPHAQSLQQDLTCVLQGTPISARPVSALTKRLRWCRRNRLAAVLSCLVLMLLAGFGIGASLTAARLAEGLKNETALRSKADAEKEKARTEEQLATEITRFLETIFVSSDPITSALLGSQSVEERTDARALLSQASIRVRNELASQPRLQARLMDTIGNIQRSIGMLDEAAELLSLSQSVRQQLLAAAPGDHHLQREQTDHDRYRACLWHAQGRTAEAIALLKDAIARREALSGAGSAGVADDWFQLGWLHLDAKHAADAEVCFDRALRIRLDLFGPDSRPVIVARLGLFQSRSKGAAPGAIQAALALADGLRSPGTIQLVRHAMEIQLARSRRDYERAEALYREALAELSVILGKEDQVYLLAQGDFAGLLWDAGKYEEAFEQIRKPIEVGRRLAPRHPQLRNAMLQVGTELMYAVRFRESEDLLRACLSIGFDDPEREQEALQCLESLLIASKRGEEALALCERSHALTLTRPSSVAWRTYIHAQALRATGNVTAADSTSRSAAAGFLALDPQSLSATEAARASIALAATSQFEEAIRFRLAALANEETRRPAMHPRIADHLISLAACRLQAGQTDGIRQLVERALLIRESRLPGEDGRIEEARRLLAKLDDLQIPK